MIPEDPLSPKRSSSLEHDDKKTSRARASVKKERPHIDTPLTDSEYEDRPKRRPSLIVALKINNVDFLRKLKERPNDKKKPLPKKRQPSVNSDNVKKIRISRSYSSSEESDTTLTNKSMRANLPPRPSTAPVKPPVPKSSTTATPAEPRTATTTPVRSSKSQVSQEQRTSHNQLLMMKMSRWAHLARNQKHESDKYTKTKPLLAGVIAMDALLAYIVAFDYEDRAEVVMQRIKHTRSWSTLVPYIGWLIKLLEEGDCRELIGMCYQIRALIHLRIASSYQEQTTRLYNSKKLEEMGETTGKLIKSQDAAVQDFKKGMRDLGMDKIEEKFPKTWKGRQKTVQPVSRHEGGYRPLEDPYYLPMHTFSSLQEGAALGYAVTKEWADKRGIECDWALQRGLGN